jgi:hypothetical protein
MRFVSRARVLTEAEPTFYDVLAACWRMLEQAWLQGVRAPATAAKSALFPWVTKAQEPVEPAENKQPDSSLLCVDRNQSGERLAFFNALGR